MIDENSLFIAFDTETTGLSAAQGKIVEIAALKFNLQGSVLDEFSYLINPGAPIPIEAVNVHHITDEIVADMPLHAKRFEFEPEFTAKILKRKVRIFEVPISFNPRDYSEGKKIGLKDAFEAVWALLKYRFVD